MTVHRALYPLESPEPAAKPPEPTVFVRNFSTPPGLPWDQGRMAALEARSGAPLPLADVIYQLRRLEPWIPGRPARFAAFYVRLKEARSNLERIVDVQGRPVRVRFWTAAERNRRAQRLGLVALAAGSFAVAVSGAMTAALAVREQTAARLGLLGQIAASRHSALKEAERQRLLGQSLDSAGVKGLKLDDVLGDLAWASAHKAPDTRIEAVHWDHGHLAVEVRGDAAPFLPGDRTVVKASKPLRPRVWLWGAERQGRRP